MTVSASQIAVFIATDILLALSITSLLYIVIYLNRHKYITLYVPKKTYVLLFLLVLCAGLAASALSVLKPETDISVPIKLFVSMVLVAIVVGAWRVIPRDIDNYERIRLQAENLALNEAVAQRQRAEVKLRAALATVEDAVADRTAELSAVNLSLSKDIVERRLSEERALENKRRLDDLILRTNTALIFVDAEGTILESNHPLAQMLGRSSSDEIVGRKLGRLLGLRTESTLQHFCSETLRKGTFALEFDASPPARGAIHVEAHGAATVVQGRPCVMAFLRDMSERKAFETELIQSREGLSAALNVTRKANATKSDFLAKMNHELRTPLNGIIGLSEIIRHKASGDKFTAKDALMLATNIHKSGSHLLSLVDDLLDLSRLDSSTREFVQTDVVVKAEIDAAVITLATIADKKRITVKNLCQDGLEWGVDQRAFKQIIINLVNNAVKFSPPGSTVEIDVTQARDSISLHIQDQGPGIDPDEQERILSPFGRGSYAETNKVDGVGLGLTIVSELLKLQGGNLQIASERGKGARFIAMFPSMQQIPAVPRPA